MWLGAALAGWVATFLRLTAVRATRLRVDAVLGIVLSQPQAEPDLSAGSNAATIASLTALPVLAELPHASAPDAVAHLLQPLATSLPATAARG